jgi:hypothetical protein
MKTSIGWTAVLVALLQGAAFAQTIGGAWQGTLQAGRELRIVIMISSADGGGLRAVMYSIDQGAQGIPATAITLQGTTVRIALAPIGGAFEGTLGADGASIAGTWTQGGSPLPLTLRRATPDTAWAIPEAPKPMAADAPAVFEVATIKPSIPDRPGRLFTVKGRQVLTVNTTVNDLISFAYEVHARQITGGQPWMATDKYDVTGQPEGQGIPNVVQLREMVRQLLTDRFQLAFHREPRDLPVYTIVETQLVVRVGLRVVHGLLLPALVQRRRRKPAGL